MGAVQTADFRAFRAFNGGMFLLARRSYMLIACCSVFKYTVMTVMAGSVVCNMRKAVIQELLGKCYIGALQDRTCSKVHIWIVKNVIECMS
jgi:hypothetical protein